jgi:hypothetical protein
LAGAAGVASLDTDAVGLVVVAVPAAAAPGAELAAAVLEAGALNTGGPDPEEAGAAAAVSDEAGAEAGAGAAFLAE